MPEAGRGRPSGLGVSSGPRPRNRPRYAKPPARNKERLTVGLERVIFASFRAPPEEGVPKRVAPGSDAAQYEHTVR